MDLRQELNKRLEDIKKVYEVEKILNRPTANQAVARYYKLNRATYYFLHSRAGFVHMGLSQKEVFSKSDYLGQAKIISEYIDSLKAESVLELGAGKGANLVYLAHRHPNVSFQGLDLKEGQFKLGTFKDISNVNVKFGDYRNLSSFSASSVDIIYMVEALCYAQDKGQVLKQIHRVLKPGGIIIVFDGYINLPFKAMAPQESLAIKLVLKSFVVGFEDQCYPVFKEKFKENGFKILVTNNLDKAIRPSIVRLEKNARWFFKKPKLMKAVNSLVPDEIAANGIAVYLMPLTTDLGLGSYYLTVARKI